MSPKTDEDTLLAELDALIGEVPPPAPAVERPPNQASAAQPSTKQAPVEQSPAARGSTVDSAPSPPPPRPSAATKVLIVDDNKDYRAILKFVLGQAGFEVLEAADGSQALDVVKRVIPALILADFEMPKLNGFELIQELRSRDETRGIPVIMLTGAQKRKRLKELGMDISEFLEKPISNAQLIEAVSRVLNLLNSPNGAEKDHPGLIPEKDIQPQQNGKKAAQSDQSPKSVEKREKPPEELKPKTDKNPPLPVEPPPMTPMLDLFDGSPPDEELTIEEQKKEEEEEHYGLDVLSNDSPLVNRVNKIIMMGVESGASDIHIEPQEKQVLVRVRINGSLQPLCTLPAALSSQLAARVKVISNLIITERRRPQDGQFRAMIKGKKIEFRVSTIPSIHGEKIVLRILGGSKIKSSLAEMGLNDHDLQSIEWAMENPHGLILVTGPTGSGKTTTLYTIIRLLNKPDVNIMTAEDPVEYELNGITQVHVKPQIHLTFESVLRSFLRQDPDIMLVGEIRDLETADIAVKASITGHLVLSTVHTNSAAATIMRLNHMGVAPYLLADSLKLIMAQRLIRTLCPKCKRQTTLSEDAHRHLSPEEVEKLSVVYESSGCADCRESGFSGRMAVYEVMPIRTREMKHLILSTQGVEAIAAQGVKEGMTALRQAALNAVAAGKTSFTEALGVIFGE